MNTGTRPATPWHLWVVGVVSLLWNAIGANDYTQTQLGNREYIEAGIAGFDIDYEGFMAYFDAFPIWAETAWALGVWGAVTGSVLLLFRSRFALSAFVVSLGGLAVTTVFQYSNPMPGVAQDNWIPIIFTIVLWIIAIALIVYARAMTARGVLR